MSTDDERPGVSGDPAVPEVPAAPRTRAEMRAAREAAAQAASAQAAPEQVAAEQAAPEQAASEKATAENPVGPPPRFHPSVENPDVGQNLEVSADGRNPSRRTVPESEGPAEPVREHVDATVADTPDVGPIRVQGPTSGVSAPGTDIGDGPADATGVRKDASATDASASDASVPIPPAAKATPAKTTPAKTPAAPRDRRFLTALGAVLGILVLVGAGLGVVSLTQGPRITEVQVNPAQAIESSGSRVILTANQSLAAVDESQVTVEPAAPFTIDASGRGIGIRFTVPLDDDTKYTVTIADARGAGGGPKADLTTTFTTPASEIFLLRRDVEGDDKIFATDLGGESAVPVFAADKINDFRATSTRLVVSVEEDDGSKLLVMDRDGKNVRELSLPGVGYVGAIQVSDRGGLVGYSYSDKELSDTEGRASVLVTQSLDGDDEPQITEVGGEEANIFVWQFVPDSAAVLFIDFDGALSLVDHGAGGEVQSLGLATTIQGVSRGTYTAIVERLDGAVVELNLADGSETPLAASDPDFGKAITITPFPGGTLRHVVARDANGVPSGQAIVRVDDDGTATPIVEVGPADSILQACASPSGQYAAVVIAPQLSDNPYDQMLLPLPQNLETHLLDLETGEEMVALTGFDASWCQTAPQF